MKSFPRTEHVHIDAAHEEVDVLKTLDEIARIEGMDAIFKGLVYPPPPPFPGEI